MGSVRLFVDFGSTFTKLVAFDLEAGELLGRVQVPSTVDTDITVGLEQAFYLLAETVHFGEEERRQTLACSSAAGGLRVVCVGLVPEYTTEAGRRAALGAGAKIVGSYSYELSESELREIEELAPDIVLLTGGTDGGNKKVIIHNASMLARTSARVPNIVVAGNKSAYDEVDRLLRDTGKNIIYTKNVMPEIGVLDVDAANHTIRDLFIARITEAKGISKVKRMIADVIMPTPAAVLEAAKLLADGLPGEPGLGELLMVDVGGATTDVYSIARGTPASGSVRYVGLPEPYAKRTVEGDLGLYHNLDTLKEVAREEQLPEWFDEVVQRMEEGRSVPSDPMEQECHVLLARAAVRAAVNRHVGQLKPVFTPDGEVWLQRGKDLTQVKWVVGAGGPVSFSSDPARVLEGAVYEAELPLLLKPKNPRFLLDEHYIFFALGLLAQSEPHKALELMRKYATPVGTA
ncbi:MAG: methylaspartate mutase accessory protein GlmL [Thermoleophilia bacterium]|nr:methylaspartate mutase accessory protein GlmL [Thermoleophilia bacterium]